MSIEELQIHGYHPHEDEPDPRPLPDADQLDQGLDLLFEGLTAALTGSRFEDDLDDLAWHLADLFHRKASRVQRSLDDNEDRQRRSQAEQDGSEVRSVELERLIVEGQTLLERRQVFEYLRDRAGEQYEALTGSACGPAPVALSTTPSSQLRSLKAANTSPPSAAPKPRCICRKAHALPFPAAPCNDHKRIWQVLDETLAHYPGMVLLHGGTPRGAERIAACWANSRKVTQIVFKPDWDRDGKAAPSSATTRFSPRSLKPLSFSRAPASPTISPTRPRSSASVSSTTARRLALKRQPLPLSPDSGRSAPPCRRSAIEA